MTHETLTSHFRQYFTLKRANTDELKKVVFKIRYDVYCDELKYESNCPKDKEQDKFDQYSEPVLIQHRSSGRYAGCVRLVLQPNTEPLIQLPYEECCSGSVEAEKIAPLLKNGRQFIGEISRLAVHQDFRRRSGEKNNPYGINTQHQKLIVSLEELRIFPFVAVSLYLASAAIALEHGLKYVIVMMEPRLARLLSRFGINFVQIGNEMEYHGTRAMFYIDKKGLFNKLKPELLELFEFVQHELGINNSQ